MKNVFCSLAVFFLLMCFSSCSKSEEIYSCDPDIDKWVKGNQEDLLEMTYAEFLTLDESYQRGVYNYYNSEKRHDVWVNKMNNVLTLNWKDEERKHLEEYLSILSTYSSILFDNVENALLQDEYDLFDYAWCEYALDELGWTPELIYAIIGTPNELLNTKGDIQLNNNSISHPITKSSSEIGKDCDCNKDTSGYYIPCNTLANKKCYWVEYYMCDATEKGCGHAWQQTCNGICLEYFDVNKM